MRNHSPKGESSPVGKWIMPVLLGTVVSLLGTAVVLMLFALLLTLQDIPQGAIVPLAIGAMGIGGFLGGYISARICGQRGLLCGFLTGFVDYIILTGISLLALHFSLDASHAVRLVVVLAACCTGGVLGVNRRGRRKA